MIYRIAFWSLAACLIAQMPAAATEPRNLKPSEILVLLDDTVNGDLFTERRKLPDALAMINLHLARRGVQLPFWVNIRAFKEENPEAPELAEIEVKARDLGPRPKVWRVLRDLLEDFPSRNAAFVVRPGYIEITTNERAMFAYQEPVMLHVRNRPLGLVLEDLFEQTGVSIAVDPHVSRKLREPVSATITQPMPLHDALSVVLKQQRLGYCTMGRISKIVYVTTPENAVRTLWQRHQMDLAHPDLLDPHTNFLGRSSKASVVDLAMR